MNIESCNYENWDMIILKYTCLISFSQHNESKKQQPIAYLRKRLRYWRLQADQEKTPLWPANVGDMMLPSDFLQTFPSPSWTIPKLES